MHTQPFAVRKQLAWAVCTLGSAAAFTLEPWGRHSQDHIDLGAHSDVLGVVVLFCCTRIIV